MGAPDGLHESSYMYLYILLAIKMTLLNGMQISKEDSMHKCFGRSLCTAVLSGYYCWYICIACTYRNTQSKEALLAL